MAKRSVTAVLLCSVLGNVILMVAYTRVHRREIDRVARLVAEVEAWMPAAQAFGRERRLVEDRATLARALTPFLTELQEACRGGDGDSCAAIAMIEDEIVSNRGELGIGPTR